MISSQIAATTTTKKKQIFKWITWRRWEKSAWMWSMYEIIDHTTTLLWWLNDSISFYHIGFCAIYIWFSYALCYSYGIKKNLLPNEINIYELLCVWCNIQLDGSIGCQWMQLNWSCILHKTNRKCCVLCVICYIKCAYMHLHKENPLNQTCIRNATALKIVYDRIENATTTKNCICRNGSNTLCSYLEL